MNRFSNGQIISTLAAVLLSGSIGAAEVDLSTGGLSVASSAGTTSSLVITGPENFAFEREVSASPSFGGANAVFGLGEMNLYGDGQYNYEVVEYRYTGGQRRVTDAETGRERALQRYVQTSITSGVFHVRNGNIVIVDDIVEE